MISIESVMQMASNPKNWKKTHKKSYEVYVCRPMPGAECTNKLEGTHYVTDQNKQFIISGTVGETWVIDINKLAKTYTFVDGTPITPDTLSIKCNNNGQMGWQKMRTRADANTNWAMLIPKEVENFPVQTSWGDTLLANRPGVGHGLGDFLVCADNGCGQPNLNDVWVVNGEVFPTTYDLHAFPNMFSQVTATAKTPYPSENFMKNNNETNKLLVNKHNTVVENTQVIKNTKDNRRYKNVKSIFDYFKKQK